MSIIKTGLLLAVVVMLLPVDERKQVELAGTVSSAAEQTAGFCDRNPSTCGAGRELWALFVRKAEYAMELGAKLLREQLARSLAEPQRPQPMPAAIQMPAAPPPSFPAPPRQPSTERQAIRFEPARSETAPQQRPGLQADQPNRWR